jgi:hypothetical protein
MAYSSTRNTRQVEISPYRPDRTEKIGNNTGQASYVDIGKPVKLSGDAVVICTAGDEIYGFISSVNAGTMDGFSVGGVVADAGREMVAVDEAGGLAVGDLVVAGTAVALGTAGVGNVAVAAGTEDGIDRWRVVGLEVSPSTAGKEVLLRKL